MRGVERVGAEPVAVDMDDVATGPPGLKQIAVGVNRRPPGQAPCAPDADKLDAFVAGNDMRIRRASWEPGVAGWRAETITAAEPPLPVPPLSLGLPAVVTGSGDRVEITIQPDSARCI